MHDKINLGDQIGANVIRGALAQERLGLHGRYEVECLGPDGKIKWQDVIENTVVTVGKNLTLDTLLAGSSYSVTGPFMGLISQVGYASIAAADTMSSHAGWKEAGVTNAPTYTVPRKTAVFAAAGSGDKALSAALSFSVTGSGTVKGAFMCLGTGAVNTVDDTNGTLLSAGLFTGGDKLVDNGDVLNVNWSLSG